MKMAQGTRSGAVPDQGHPEVTIQPVQKCFYRQKGNTALTVILKNCAHIFVRFQVRAFFSSHAHIKGSASSAALVSDKKVHFAVTHIIKGSANSAALVSGKSKKFTRCRHAHFKGSASSAAMFSDKK